MEELLRNINGKEERIFLLKTGLCFKIIFMIASEKYKAGNLKFIYLSEK